MIEKFRAGHRRIIADGNELHPVEKYVEEVGWMCLIRRNGSAFGWEKRWLHEWG